MTDRTREYAPGRHPDLPPPPGTIGAIGWLRANLFSSVFNTILTFASAGLFGGFVVAAIDWLVLDAVVDAGSRVECREFGNGACWAVVATRLEQFAYGFYPADARWRPNLAFILLFVALAPVLYDGTPYRRRLLLFSMAYPFIGGWLIYGGLGLKVVETQLYGGFLLTLIIGLTGIFGSLPIGILLALGRQSRLVAVRVMCISFIEFMRGVPLIALLFVASTMLNYFMPPGTTFDLLIRVLIMVTLFASGYIAEVIRGGIQAISRGQNEAADALGLSYWKTTALITLPQALKVSIPGLVNCFISLYKDTTLVLIIGLLDPLGISRAVLADSNWNGLTTETYLFCALFFFVSCFAMSRYSLWLEKQLNTGHRPE